MFTKVHTLVLFTLQGTLSPGYMKGSWYEYRDASTAVKNSSARAAYDARIFFITHFFLKAFKCVGLSDATEGS
jgi:hypothetical protein